MIEEDKIDSQFSYFKKIAFIIIFFTLTPLALFSSAISLIAISQNSYNNESQNKDSFNQGAKIYASLPVNNSYIAIEVESADARPLILKNFLENYNSPLSDYSEFLVKTSEKYGLDWRLLTAIAMKESGACKAIPEDSHNCWGWGIHSKGTLKFDNYQEAIEVVSKGLKDNYIDMGYITVEEIMKKYAHPDSTTWAEGVNYYIEQMR